ncbi:lipoprotein [Aquabacter sp. CN5-332]|uniref:LPS translocon maturation chaperone LptM n=1 Tax=Aquabacter sp. CN5-332 TaxID=3156608 RepID=UPI0032B566CF
MSFRPLLLSCAVALALAGCGVKGPLELPPNANGTQPPQASTPPGPAPSTMAQDSRQASEQAWGANPVDTGGINPPDMPGNSVSRPAPAATTTTQKSFFLDFLL